MDKKKNPLFFEIIPSINDKTGNWFKANPDDTKEYKSFLVNKNYGMGRDTVLFANEMNKYWHLDDRFQYDFYYYGLPPGKRFNKWAKSEKNEDVEAVQEYFEYSEPKARDVLKLLNPEELAEIKEFLSSRNA